MFATLPVALQLLIGPLLLLLKPNDGGGMPANAQMRFQLRHQHALANDTRVVFADVAPSLVESGYTLNVKTISTHKPPSQTAYNRAWSRAMRAMQSDAGLWTNALTPAPNVEDRETLLTLAKMTSNAYYEPKDSEWYHLPSPWSNHSFPFGWEPDADGFRGHIFVSDDNSTVVLSIKGTSPGWLAGSGGPTVVKDKLNDNLLFSCCCARVGPTWSTVCGCYSGGKSCDVNCLSSSLSADSLFYNVATNLYNNVTYMYPNANIWLIGHSLGGALASLLGSTFGAPVVAFEAPGERMAASRLHLPMPPSTLHITHVLNTADSIAMGVCTGVTSICAVAGYALESKCHLGQVIKYDTVSKLGWSVSVRSHSIDVVIKDILNKPWETTPDGAVVREVPPAEEEVDCIDCFDWEFGHFKQPTSLLGHP